jgi:hypothetical protein
MFGFLDLTRQYTWGNVGREEDLTQGRLRRALPLIPLLSGGAIL